MRTKIKIKVENYDITAATGYKTGLDGTIDDAACKNAFDQNAYTSLPAPDSNNPMVAADQSSMFTKISYASVDEAKTALLSDTINTAISNYVDGTPAYSLESGNLIMDCYFTNEDNLKAWSQAAVAVGAWNTDGAVVSHI
jgi:hypothetical protein